MLIVPSFQKSLIIEQFKGNYLKQNDIVMFFELVAAECFYVSRDLFPDFGYGKLKCVFAII